MRVRFAPVAALALLLGLFATVALAQGEREVPYLSGRVVDLANVVDDATISRIESRLAAYEQQTGSQVAVLTVPDLDDEPIEDYSMRVVEAWQLGRTGVDDGVLLLIAQQERRLRIEVGYGLEGTLTDAYSRRILDNVVTPRFKQGDFAGGVESGVEAILAVLEGNADELPAPAPVGGAPSPIGCLMLIFLVLFFFFLLSLMARSIKRSGGWSSNRGGWIVLPPTGGGRSWGGGGGFGGGGFGGFSGGGGGFGGGGASGGW